MDFYGELEIKDNCFEFVVILKNKTNREVWKESTCCTGSI